jgi:hypothetical protein
MSGHTGSPRGTPSGVTKTGSPERRSSSAGQERDSVDIDFIHKLKFLPN